MLPENGGEEAFVKVMEMRRSLFVDEGRINKSPMFQPTYDRLFL